MSTFRSGNLLLAFALELAMLVALGIFGWNASGTTWLKFGLALGLPALAIAAWAVWGAPKSKTRLKGGALLIFKIVMFAIATVAWWAAGQGFIGTIFAVLAAINLLAGMALRQE
jgi:hypothetical protein